MSVAIQVLRWQKYLYLSGHIDMFYPIAGLNERISVLSMSQYSGLLRQIPYLECYKFDKTDDDMMVDLMIFVVMIADSMIVDLMIENSNMIAEAFVWISSHNRELPYFQPLDLICRQCWKILRVWTRCEMDAF